MGEKTSISWTEATWNPWHGCRKVSKGCQFCYMYRDKEKYGQDPLAVVKSISTFNAPLSKKMREPRMIFTCSWSDWFIEEADAWRPDAWEIIRKTPHHFYQILTKRPERIAGHLPADWGAGYANVALGVSIEDQEAADKRLPILMRTPAKCRIVSIEPLLSKVNMMHVRLRHFTGMGSEWLNALDGNEYLSMGRIARFKFGAKMDWLIIGGESGNETGYYRYRPCELAWIEQLVLQGDACQVPVFVKQTGTWLAKKLGLADRSGADISEFPTSISRREFPLAIREWAARNGRALEATV